MSWGFFLSFSSIIPSLNNPFKCLEELRTLKQIKWILCFETHLMRTCSSMTCRSNGHTSMSSHSTTFSCRPGTPTWTGSLLSWTRTPDSPVKVKKQLSTFTNHNHSFSGIHWLFIYLSKDQRQRLGVTQESFCVEWLYFWIYVVFQVFLLSSHY